MTRVGWVTSWSCARRREGEQLAVAEHLKKPLEDYVKDNWAGLVRIHRLQVRGGPAIGRNAAAQISSKEEWEG